MAFLIPETVVELSDATLAKYAAELEDVLDRVSARVGGESSPAQSILNWAETEALRHLRLIEVEQDRRAAQSKRLGPVLRETNLREQGAFDASEHAPRVPLGRIQVHDLNDQRARVDEYLRQQARIRDNAVAARASDDNERSTDAAVFTARQFGSNYEEENTTAASAAPTLNSAFTFTYPYPSPAYSSPAGAFRSPTPPPPPVFRGRVPLGFQRGANRNGPVARSPIYMDSVAARKAKVEDVAEEEAKDAGHGPSTRFDKGKKRAIEPSRAKEDPADNGALADDEASPRKRQRSEEDQGWVRRGGHAEHPVAEPLSYEAPSRASCSRKEQHVAAFRARIDATEGASSTASPSPEEKAAAPGAQGSAAARVTLPPFADVFGDIPRPRASSAPQTQERDATAMPTPAPVQAPVPAVAPAAVAPPPPAAPVTNKMGINFVLDD